MEWHQRWQAKWLRLEIVHPDVQKLANAISVFAMQWFGRRAGNRWLVIVGAVGCGKTHVAKALRRWAERLAFDAWAAEWHKNNPTAIPVILFQEWIDFASPESCSDEEFREFIRDVDAASLVIVDDIGIECDQFKSGIPAQRLCQLLNACEGKFLLLTTNVRPNEWQKKWDQRVEDRLLSGETIQINSPSYRSEI